ncbi:protein YABBY 3-like [Oryza glaberrima]|uniref:protein YABBY 3-like n=1 Tax=Oryza glaberrima TaxID=4538 RepID=UPI00224C2562|nr:protein YABBY 3-like [Oryza glaberrima]XP_052159392.1 protein YABBY 3-like [Oryza glaberrima]
METLVSEAKVSVPSSSLFKTVTARCGHCSSQFLTVNIRGLLLPTSAAAGGRALPHSLNLAPPANPPHHHSLLDEILTASSPTQLLLEQHGLGGLMASAASCRNNNVCRNNKKTIAFLRWALRPLPSSAPGTSASAPGSPRSWSPSSPVSPRASAHATTSSLVRMAVINFLCVPTRSSDPSAKRGERKGEKRGKREMTTWHPTMWDPRGSHADSAVTWDKTGVNTRVIGFV